MRVSAFLLALIFPALVNSKATIDNEWELFENTIKRWNVQIRDKRDMVERFTRLKAFKQSVDKSTTDVILDSLSRFSVNNNEEHEATMEMRRRNVTFSPTNRADKERLGEEKLMKLAKRHGHHDGEDKDKWSDYWEHEIGFNTPGHQGGCGACWAFAAMGAVEVLYKKLTGEQVDLSEAYFVDCSFEFSGCTGGQTDDLFFITKRRQYIPTEEAYRFDNVSPLHPHTCPHWLEVDANKQLSGTSEFNGMKKMWLQDSYRIGNKLEDWFAGLAVSPVTFAVHVSLDFHRYSGGNFVDIGCVGAPEPHAALFVGYTKTTLRVRNSYGPEWGEGGYVNYFRDMVALNNCIMFEYGYVIEATQRREKEYSFCNDKKMSTRKQCSDSCEAKGHGWTLATIPTLLHNEILVQLVNEAYPGKSKKEKFNIFHMGLTKDENDGWSWSEECTPLNYVNLTSIKNGNFGLLNKVTGKWVLKKYNKKLKARGLCSRAVNCWDISSAIKHGNVRYYNRTQELLDVRRSGDLKHGHMAEVTCEGGKHMVGGGHLVCRDGIWYSESIHDDIDYDDYINGDDFNWKHGSFDELPSCRALGEEEPDPHDTDDVHGIVSDQDHEEKEHADHTHQHGHEHDEYHKEEERKPAKK